MFIADLNTYLAEDKQIMQSDLTKSNEYLTNLLVERISEFLGSSIDEGDLHNLGRVMAMIEEKEES
jgi:hypothetical protein